MKWCGRTISERKLNYIATHSLGNWRCYQFCSKWTHALEFKGSEFDTFELNKQFRKRLNFQRTREKYIYLGYIRLAVIIILVVEDV